jgi:hypothetical protein
MTKPVEADSRYILSELEVYGRGGPVAVPKPAGAPQADGSLQLAGGNWRLQRASLVQATGKQISTTGFADKDWMIATVPGTVFTSYLNDEAIANPDFGENQYAISDSFFCADFWYRDEFAAPAGSRPGRHFWLNFDGVNWKAAVYLKRNGAQWHITTELHNVSAAPALMVRVKAVRNKSRDPILPAIYDDNYIALMPGERRTIVTDLENADTRGERPRLIVEGYNLTHGNGS